MITGVITNAGLTAAQQATNNEGFDLTPKSFAVSDVAGNLDVSRTAANAGLFYQAPISARVVVDQNTLKYTLTIPPNQIPAGTSKQVREVYLFIDDGSGGDILFAVGQSTETLNYNAGDELTLDVNMQIQNLNVLDNFVFKFTQATELAQHEIDPNAHPDFIEAFKKLGVFIPAGAYPFERKGQFFENNGGNGVEFDGTKASVTYQGVVFTAEFNGTELNSLSLNFDGSKTIQEVVLAFNEANYPNTVSHNGTGTDILPAGTPTLSGGTYNVLEKDLVYLDVDGVYKQALADGTIRGRVAGVAFLEEKVVQTSGLIDINTGYANSTPIYLSGDQAGKVTDFDTNVVMGLALENFIYFIGFSGDTSVSVNQQFDAVVTNASGLGQFNNTQAAIDFVPNTGRILVNKLELLRATLDTKGKKLNIVFNGPLTGWKRFEGLGTIWRVDFDLIPTQGTFRIEWQGQETNNLAFNATALDVQNEFNLLNGHNGVVVTGNFNDGFTFTFNGLDFYPTPAFTFAGVNEIQRFDFSNIPNDGTIAFEFKNETTRNIPWDDDLATFQGDFDGLASTNDVLVSGGFDQQFIQVEFQGGWLQDGVQPQPKIEVVQTDLDLNGSSTNVNGTTVTPIPAQVTQNGKEPSSNLYDGTNAVTISVTSISEGEQPGDQRAIEVDSTQIRFEGLGKVEGFNEGVVLLDSATDVKFEAYFVNVVKPVLSLDKVAGIDYDFEFHGFAKDFLSQLKITEHPTNKKRVKITGAEQILASGVQISQPLNNLLMSFEGAEIDFGVDPIAVYESDGVTPLGLNIDRPVIGPETFRWFSINIVPFEQQADGSLSAQILLLPAGSNGASLAAAEKPPLSDQPIGAVAVEGALGDKELTQITTVRDQNGSLKGKTLILYHPNESVAFWVSDPSLDTFTIEETTGVTGVDEDLFDSTAERVLAARIDVTTPVDIDRLHLFLRKAGSPTGSVDIRVLGDNGGVPDLNNVIATAASSLSVNDVPTNFDNPVEVDLSSTASLAAGTYYVEVNGANLTFSAGNNLAWNTENNGVAPRVFNRDPLSNSWLTDLGNKTANVELVSKTKGIPTLAQTATRNVEVTTIVENDFQVTVANKFHAFIDAEGIFNATVATNKIDVENSILGAVQDADIGDTGFFADILTEGTDTDPSGIEDISNYEIKQFISGAGSGGSGDANALLERFKNALDLSLYKHGTPVIFDTDQEDFTANASTANFSITDGGYVFSVGQFFESTDLADQQILENNVIDLPFVRLTAFWKFLNLDPNAIYEVTRDGVEWQAFTMEQNENSDTFYGEHEFTDEINNSYIQNLGTSDGVSPLDTTQLSRVFGLNAVTVLKELNTNITVVGTPVGSIFFKVVKDNGGVPSTNLNDEVFISSPISVSTLTTGALETLLGTLVLASGSYHVVVFGDSTYTEEYTASAGANRIDFASEAGIGITGSLEGRQHDLRMRVTSSINDVVLLGVAVEYRKATQITYETDSLKTARYSFLSNTDNPTSFALPFKPHDRLLQMSVGDTGQTFKISNTPDVSISGNSVLVPENFFQRPSDVPITVEFFQFIQSSVIDNSDDNSLLLAENHLGSLDPSLDKSISGRGLKIRRNDGQLMEPAAELDNQGNTVWVWYEIN